MFPPSSFFWRTVSIRAFATAKPRPPRVTPTPSAATTGQVNVKSKVKGKGKNTASGTTGKPSKKAVVAQVIARVRERKEQEQQGVAAVVDAVKLEVAAVSVGLRKRKGSEVAAVRLAPAVEVTSRKLKDGGSRSAASAASAAAAAAAVAAANAANAAAAAAAGGDMVEARKKAGKAASNVQRGTEYEEQVVSILESWKFSVKRTGKAGDEGVDFRGNWGLPGGDSNSG